ncbi:MAG: C39 family peptidase [Candidatus Portnoybacteria bacterium]|nr:C39 family peptidase [Candidatus Portnoybacteria bacterium]
MELLKIKPFQEALHKGYCGPAVLKMILGYYGIDISEKELAKLSGASKNMGIDDKAIVAVLQKSGLKAAVKNNANFSDIKGYFSKNIPVIVDWFSRGRQDYAESEVADGHYSIVAGLDEKFIFLQDPEIGKMRKLKREDFLRVWFDYSGEYPKSKNQFIIRQLIAVYR